MFGVGEAEILQHFLHRADCLGRAPPLRSGLGEDHLHFVLGGSPGSGYHGPEDRLQVWVLRLSSFSPWHAELKESLFVPLRCEPLDATELPRRAGSSPRRLNHIQMYVNQMRIAATIPVPVANVIRFIMSERFANWQNKYELLMCERRVRVERWSVSARS